MSDAPKVTVLYVLSSPHSGSTLLGAALSSHPKIGFAGELFEIPVPAWDPGRPCSCGQPAGACPYWTAVRSAYERLGSIAELREGEAAYDPWRALPRVWSAKLVGSKRLRAHAARIRGLAQTIAGASGRPIVMDSSKGAARGLCYALARSDEFDVRFLHLVRDGRGVVGSRKSREVRVSPTGEFDPHAVVRYSVLWVLANLAFVLLFGLRRDRYLRLRYEDFTRDPEGTLSRLCGFLGVDPGPLIDHLRRGGDFPIVHVVAGNRLRLAGPVRIRPATPDWEQRLTPGELRAYSLIAGGAARLFGYPDPA